jgi:hypothetical protein
MFDYVDDQTKLRILNRWKGMSETDKTHFINQVAIVLSIWGSDEDGKRLVVDVLKFMAGNGSTTLADFGLYVDKLTNGKLAPDRKKKVERASLILESYRLKNGLSSIPHRDILI